MSIEDIKKHNRLLDKKQKALDIKQAEIDQMQTKIDKARKLNKFYATKPTGKE